MANRKRKKSRSRKNRQKRRRAEATNADKKAQKARSQKYGIGAKKGGNVTKPAAYKDVPESKFADPVNFRYPLSPPARAVNAITRFNDGSNRAAGGYTTAEWAKIGGRIAKANKGKAYRDGKVVDANRKKEAKPKGIDKSESLSAFENRVRNAFYHVFERKQAPGQPHVDLWVKDVWPEYVVAKIGQEMFVIPFSDSDDDVIVFESDVTKWTKVKLDQQYIPVNESLQLLAISEGKKKTERGTEWEVIVIGAESASDVVTEGGKEYIRSKNGRLYLAEALEASVPLFDGVKVYDNHLTDEEFNQKQGMRSVANEWVGVIVDPFWDKAAKAIKGTLKIIDATLRKKLVEAHDAGVLNAIGLSIDALGQGATRAVKALGGKMLEIVEKIDKALSVDVVADPAAGGRLARLIAAQTIKAEGIEMTPEEIKALIESVLKDALAPAVTEAIAPLQEQVDGLVTRLDESEAEEEEEVEAEVEAEVEEEAEPESDEPPAVTEAVKRAEEAAAKAKEAEQRLLRQAAENDLEAALKESGLPAPNVEMIREQFSGEIFESEVLKETIESHRGMLTSLSESGQVRLPEGHRISVEPVTEWDKYELGFLRLLMGQSGFNAMTAKAKAEQGKTEDEIDPYAPQRFSEAVKRFVEAGNPAIHYPMRLTEWYYDVMGGVDAAIAGEMRNKRLLEAAVTTSSVTSIVKNTLNLMVAADYSVRERWWEAIVRNEDVDTLDDSTLVRVYGMDGLNTMSEGDAYQEMDWSDEEETASFVKRGGYIGVTLETFLRDKINVLRTIPTRMSNAWYNEISDHVSAVFTVNSAAGPVLADNGALFNATALTTAGGHKNLLTTALSYTAFVAARLEMRKQTDQPLGVGRKLGIQPRFLLAPVDLETTAEQIRDSEMIPSQSGGATTGGEFQTRNTVQGKFDIVVVPTWTDTNNWALVADPAMWPAIYLVWLRGRRTPELFAASDERSGSMFTNDTIRYKVRMFLQRFSSTYDCAPIGDFRPLHKSNV